MNDVTIPPLSAKIIQTTTAAPPMSVIFTPSSKQLNKQHIFTPHAILTINNNVTTTTLLNTTTTIQTIPKGTTIGQVKYHEDNKCCYVCPDLQGNYQHHISAITSCSIQQKLTSHSPITSTIDELISHLPRTQQEQIRPVLFKHKSIFNTPKPSSGGRICFLLDFGQQVPLTYILIPSCHQLA
ncbi:unnamed protein product [Rotaria sordida]|uniref:Uncharacterized protein n=1 Tax=Rotaria sordida TaxID=392033 RepID=A0A814MC63_9BILA|nr:unnamed protein product [Rotaria sordida]